MEAYRFSFGENHVVQRNLFSLRSAHEAVVLVLDGADHGGHVFVDRIDAIAGAAAVLLVLGLAAVGGRLLQLGLVHRELDGLGSGLGAQVVHAWNGNETLQTCSKMVIFKW